MGVAGRWGLGVPHNEEAGGPVMHGEETRPLASRAHEVVTGVHREVGVGWVFELSRGWLQHQESSFRCIQTGFC